jgi:hypothetical protein
MNNQARFRLLVIVLLAAMLGVQVMILERMPKPSLTVGDVYGSKPIKKEILRRIPVVEVYSVMRPVDVEVGNTVNVDVDTPLDVRIVR